MAELKHTIITESIMIPYHNEERTLRIYLPPNYSSGQDFPVIYMHDAQNLFDLETSSFNMIWDIHTHLNRYYEETGQAYIVVGLDNHEGAYNRFNEYSPWVNTELKDNQLLDYVKEDIGGLGKKYIDFIVNDLKVYVDANYNTLSDRENTFMIGSSMGGLISLYAGMAYPHIFSRIGAFSTAIWFARQALFDMMRASKDLNQTKWYLDIGTQETSNHNNNSFNDIYLNDTVNYHKELKEKVSEDKLLLVVEEEALHNELAWSRRFYKAFEFLAK